MLTLTLALLFIACAHIVRREFQLRRLLQGLNAAVAQSKISAELVTRATKLVEERAAAFTQLHADHAELEEKYRTAFRKLVEIELCTKIESINAYIC